jgi:hypothetical protein
MFYDSNEVDNELSCKHCEKRLVEPKFIPCGETICSLCEKSIQVNDQMFDCLVCKKKHEMPKDGLLKNKLALKMLSIKPTKISRGKAFNTFQESLNHIRMIINLIKHGVNNRDDYVKEHCIELKNNAQLVAEEVIQQINDFIIVKIKEIDDYGKEQLKERKDMENVDLNSSSSSLKDLNEFLKEIQSFYDENIKRLNENQFGDSVLVKLNETAINMGKKAEDKIKCLQQINFGGRVLKFDAKCNEQIDLGALKMIDNRMSSTLLPGRNQVKDLLSLCEFPVDQKWNLIYRASQDGFEAAKFHTNCDNKTNTLTVIKTTNGNVFGGYTEQTWNYNDSYSEQTWNNTGGYKADPNSFIFSLINKLNEPIKIKWSRNNGISCQTTYGPIFGGGYDFNIANQSNINTNSYSNLGHSYTHSDYRFETNEAKTFLAGSYNFQVSEIEVYTKD